MSEYDHLTWETVAGATVSTSIGTSSVLYILPPNTQ